MWLFWAERQNSHTLFAVAVDPETFDHPVERAAIDAENFGGACAIAAGDLEDVKQITSFELVENRQVFKESREW